jgi:hypothetical protein
MPGQSAVVGYAVGTAQVLVVDWWRKIAAHQRQLRLIRSELRRLRTFSSKFGWVNGLPPEDEQLAIPPIPTDLFIKTVAELDWTLTDEHRDDNSQQAILQLLDGYALLKRYADWVGAVAEKAPNATAGEKGKLRERGATYADAYDARIDEVMLLTDETLTDIERRLANSGFWKQIRRIKRHVLGLPKGTNPPPLVANDPRIAEWKAKQVPSSS